MITDFIKEDHIKVGITADTWQDAVKQSGQLLLEIDAIEERYIDAMINKVVELGNYIVIAPGIAMPHARPEDGAKKTAITLMTLKEGVSFGHEKNDPVTLIVGLSAIDNKLHLEALASLMELLGNDEKLQLILNSKSEKELYSHL